MYAVVTTGGKQYRVEAGSELIVERLGADAGASITFDRVLLVGDGDAITVGTPTVSGATVSATVLGEALGPKLAVFKFKQKVKYRRMAGHRQHLVRVRIDEISAAGRTSSATDDEPEPAPAKPKRTRAAKADRTGAADDAPAAAAEPSEPESKPKRTRKPAAKADAPADGEAAAKPKRTRKPATPKTTDTTNDEE